MGRISTVALFAAIGQWNIDLGRNTYTCDIHCQTGCCLFCLWSLCSRTHCRLQLLHPSHWTAYRYIESYLQSLYYPLTVTKFVFEETNAVLPRLKITWSVSEWSFCFYGLFGFFKQCLLHGSFRVPFVLDDSAFSDVCACAYPTQPNNTTDTNKIIFHISSVLYVIVWKGKQCNAACIVEFNINFKVFFPNSGWIFSKAVTPNVAMQHIIIK